MGSLPAHKLDALVIGAGFSGIYALHLLRDAGLHVRVIDKAGDVGGTWYWNRYPGAMSDTEAFVYRYSWDKEHLQTYDFPDRYVKGPQARQYLEAVVERHDLRRNMQFDTEVIDATWDETEQRWYTATDNGDFDSKYLISCLGNLTEIYWPDIKGLKEQTFQRELYHTARFPLEWDFTGKRVGIIGNGSTGVQVMTALAQQKKVQSMVSFQRSPQYSVPAGDRPITEDELADFRSRYDQIWEQARSSKVGFGFTESTTPASSVTYEERQRLLQASWDTGNGFRFLYTFADIAFDRQANLEVCEFIKKKIFETVKDPEKARKLIPDEIYARRPLCDAGYYQIFNEDFVDIVSLRETPIAEVTEKGIRTADGVEREFDVIIVATGFDALDGSYNRVRFQGKHGETLREHWTPRPTSYMSFSVANFPNLFLIPGPLGPFANYPPQIEIQTEYTRDMILQAEKENASIEVTKEAEEGWTAHCESLAEGSLFLEGRGWIFGRNIPGKRVGLNFYFGGLKAFQERVNGAMKNDWEGWVFTPRRKASNH